MCKEKLITEFTASFEERKTNLGFNVQEGSACVYLIADGLQMADVVKMLLLKGKGKTFKVCIYEDKRKGNSGQIPKIHNLTGVTGKD